MPPDYPLSQLITDLMTTFQDSAAIVVPVACVVGAVAFVIAWFMDSIDVAGRTFGRHR
jgi:ABC-type Fe3+ transport system permease subunit